MSLFRRYLKRSPVALSVLTAVILPLTGLLLLLDRCFMRWADYLVKATLYAKSRLQKKPGRICRLIYRHFTADRLNPQLAMQMKRCNAPIPASFASAIVFRNACREGIVLPEMIIKNKIIGAGFARALGLKTPQLFQQEVPFEAIVPREQVVIKPVDMYYARGVHLVRASNDILELNTGKIFTSWDELKAHLSSLLKQQIVREDSWMVEQLISGPSDETAMDLKIFVFYGVLGLTAEMKRYPKILCDLKDERGNTYACGLYPRNQMFEGPGVSRPEVELAERISLEVPTPFLRIDFLRGRDGLYFGEFTPQPGSMGYLGREMDHRLGVLFQEAEARLVADLLVGKRFELFSRIAAT